jgi:hypothetical protein
MAVLFISPLGHASTTSSRYRWNAADAENLWLITSSNKIENSLEALPVSPGESTTGRKEEYGAAVKVLL